MTWYFRSSRQTCNDCQFYSDQCNSLRDEVESLEIEIPALKAKIQRLEAENAELKQLLDQAKDDDISQTDYIVKLERHVSDLIAEKKDLRKQLPWRWIPVSERRPSSDDPVLVCYHTDEIGINQMPSCGTTWAYDDYLTVTHWMPLPRLPEE